MIKVFATGNLGKDAETKQVNDEHSVTSFSIASNENIKGEDVTTWINCKKWNAGRLSEYLTKGTKVAVSGKLEIREYEGKYYTSIIVDTLEFMGSKERTGQDTAHDNGNEVCEGARPSAKQGFDDEEENNLPF